LPTQACEPKVNAGYLTLENVALLPHIGSVTAKTRDAMGYKPLDNLDAVMLNHTMPPIPSIESLAQELQS
jgi:lactate dehydrogenase-like 2-hydroxyacid dehydrogenase